MENEPQLKYRKQSTYVLDHIELIHLLKKNQSILWSYLVII